VTAANPNMHSTNVFTGGRMLTINYEAAGITEFAQARLEKAAMDAFDLPKGTLDKVVNWVLSWSHTGQTAALVAVAMSGPIHITPLPGVALRTKWFRATEDLVEERDNLERTVKALEDHIVGHKAEIEKLDELLREVV